MTPLRRLRTWAQSIWVRGTDTIDGMAGSTLFPTSADTFAKATPTYTATPDSTGRDHAERHDDVEAAVEAVQAHALSHTHDLEPHSHEIADLTATGSRNASTFLRGDNTWAAPPTDGGTGGVTDHGALTGLGDDDHTQYAKADGTRGAFAAPLGANDNYVTDAEKTALHGHSNKTALDAVSGTNTGDQTLPTWTTLASKPAVIGAGATELAARTAIGAAPTVALLSRIGLPIMADSATTFESEAAVLAAFGLSSWTAKRTFDSASYPGHPAPTGLRVGDDWVDTP